MNRLNQYIAAGGAGFGYDLNGNLISDGSRTFTYDVENRLVAASGGVSLRYDPLGRMYEVAGPSGTTQFLYDGDALVGEYVGGQPGVPFAQQNFEARAQAFGDCMASGNCANLEGMSIGGRGTTLSF